MKIAKAILLLGAILASGCVASGKPKTVLINETVALEHLSIVHPSAVAGGLMMIRAVDGKSTFHWTIGYLGSIYVPPGTHEFEVEVSHDFGIQDAGGPAWTAPVDVITARLEGIQSGSILVKRGLSRPHSNLEAGKTYEVKFGFDRKDPQNPIPVTWISPIPGV